MVDCVAAVGQPVCALAQGLLSIASQQMLACEGERWQRSLGDRLEKMYNLRRPNGTHWSSPIEPRGHDRFNGMMPAVPNACELKKYGKGDGSKKLCGLQHMGADDKCTVLSIGSRGDINFERDILRRTNCSVEIFDCTVPRCNHRRVWPAEMRTGRLRYNQVCIDAMDRTETSSQIRDDWKSSKGSFAFRTYESILAKRQLSSVTAMKMDIEGFEYVVLGAMLRRRSHALPSQIAFELHWQTQMTPLSWHHRAKTAGEIALFSRALYDAGYRTLSRADNFRCPHCSEFNVIRLFCPPELAGIDPPAEAPPPPASAADDHPGWGPSDPGEGCAAG